jgi:hypothetical protein
MYRESDDYDVQRAMKASQTPAQSSTHSNVGMLLVAMALVAAPIFAFFLIIFSGL